MCFLFPSFVSCNPSVEEGSPFLNETYYSYGTNPIPGTLPPLSNSYRPVNLSSKTYTLDGQVYSPMNFVTQDLSFIFDVKAKRALGKSIITFEMSEVGIPYFELLATVREIKLNNNIVSFKKIQDPEGQKQTFIALDSSLNPGGRYDLELTYELLPTQLSFACGGVKLLTNMTDLNTSRYFENWGPVSFEDDAFSLSLNLKILNSTSTHALYTNGAATKIDGTEWKINFPDYYTKSSFYVHLTNATDLISKKFIYQGLEREISVQVYSETASLVKDAVATLPSLFAEFETDYGPYAHSTFTAYMHKGSGGMEYVGATITSLGSLDHELLHSWFARGVMPAEGRSGWIDEAFASWRDYNYFQAPSLLSRAATNLAGYSPYRKSTANNSYVDGRQLVAELDRLFADFGGMKPMMKLFFERYKHRVVTNEELWNFLSSLSLMNLDAYFQRYTLGAMSPQVQSLSHDQNDSKHPHPLTPEEVLNLR